MPQWTAGLCPRVSRLTWYLGVGVVLGTQAAMALVQKPMISTVADAIVEMAAFDFPVRRAPRGCCCITTTAPMSLARAVLTLLRHTCTTTPWPRPSGRRC